MFWRTRESASELAPEAPLLRLRAETGVWTSPTTFLRLVCVRNQQAARIGCAREAYLDSDSGLLQLLKRLVGGLLERHDLLVEERMLLACETYGARKRAARGVDLVDVWVEDGFGLETLYAISMRYAGEAAAKLLQGANETYGVTGFLAAGALACYLAEGHVDAGVLWIAISMRLAWGLQNMRSAFAREPTVRTTVVEMRDASHADKQSGRARRARAARASRGHACGCSRRVYGVRGACAARAVEVRRKARCAYKERMRRE